MSLDYRNCDPVACPRDWVSADSGWRSGRESLACDAAACSAAHIALLRWFPTHTVQRMSGCTAASASDQSVGETNRRERSAHNDELCFEDRGRSADPLRSADGALPRKQGLRTRIRRG